MGPAVLPYFHEGGAGCGGIDEFAVAIAVGLFAVGGEEVGPAGAHVAGHVFHDDRDGVGFFIDGDEELLVCDLLHGAFGELLVVAKHREGVFEVRRGELRCHAVQCIRILCGPGAGSGNREWLAVAYDFSEAKKFKRRE